MAQLLGVEVKYPKHIHKLYEWYEDSLAKVTCIYSNDTRSIFLVETYESTIELARIWSFIDNVSISIDYNGRKDFINYEKLMIKLASVL